MEIAQLIYRGRGKYRDAHGVERSSNRVPRHLVMLVDDYIIWAVEEVVFCNTLQRYNDYVRVADIKQTVGLKAEECEPLVDLHARAGDISREHDKSGGRALGAPNARDVREDVEKRKKALEAPRLSRQASIEGFAICRDAPGPEFAAPLRAFWLAPVAWKS